MRWKESLAFAICSIALSMQAPLSVAQPSEYRKTHSGDIISGYVPEGEAVETSGYLWFSEMDAFLNVARPSARAPLLIDVGLPPEKWSSLKYGLWPDGGLKNAEKETQGRRDCREAAAG